MSAKRRDSWLPYVLLPLGLAVFLFFIAWGPGTPQYDAAESSPPSMDRPNSAGVGFIVGLALLVWMVFRCKRPMLFFFLVFGVALAYMATHGRWF